MYTELSPTPSSVSETCGVKLDVQLCMVLVGDCSVSFVKIK